MDPKPEEVETTSEPAPVAEAEKNAEAPEEAEPTKEDFLDEQPSRDEAATTSEDAPAAEAPAESSEDAKPPAENNGEEDAKPPAVIAAEGEEDAKPPAATEPKDVADNNDNKPATDGAQDLEKGKPEGEGGEKKPAKKKKEINPLFKDVQETGAWGGISKAEKIGVGVLALIVIVVVVVVLVIFVPKDSDPSEEMVPAATQAPTPMATGMPPDQKLPILLEEIQANPITAPLAASLSSDPAYYEGMVGDGFACSDAPHECAMSWILHSDEFPPATNNLRDRFGLAAIFYSMGGNDWFNKTNWLSSVSYCQWYGLSCNRMETEVEDMALESNNLQGNLPEELSLISSLGVISMKDNAVTGPLSGDLISSLPKLFVLYLQDNQMTGTIPTNLRDNEDESLANLFLQHNGFTGIFPAVYCDAAGKPLFNQFSLDCMEKVACEDVRCCASSNCF